MRILLVEFDLARPCRRPRPLRSPGGLVRRPGWVQELDFQFGPQVSRALDRPRRIFSLLLIAFGAVCLPFTLGLVSTALIGPILLVALGLLLLWRRAR